MLYMKRTSLMNGCLFYTKGPDEGLYRMYRGGVVGDTQRGIVACRIASVSGLATVVPTSVSVFVFSISIICQYLFKTFKVKSYGKL